MNRNRQSKPHNAASSMGQKHSRIERAIEDIVTEVCRLRDRGLWFGVDQVEVSGRPVERIRVWATLRLLPDGSPFCCGEPECQLGLIERGAEINERISLELRLPSQVEVEFAGRVRVDHAPGVTFRCDLA